MSEWKEYKLGDIAEILDFKRKPLSSMERSTRKGIYPYYGASGIIDNIDDFIFEGEHVLISEDGENLRTRQTPIAFLANGKFWVNNHAHIVKSDSEHNRLICYYFAQLDLNPYITGAVQPKLSQDSLNKIPIYLPTSIDERKRIVGVLSSLDDKIDLLHRENATLEALAETLFRHYFIAPPNPEKKQGKLCDYIKTTSGGTPSRKISNYYTAGTIDWVKSKELEGSFIYKTEERITEEAVLNSSAKLLPANSVLIAMYGATVGEYGILACPMACNQAVCALIPNENYPYSYLLGWTICNKKDLINLATGAAQQNISQDLIKQQIICTDFELIKTYDNQVRSLFEKIKYNQQQILTLSSQRDTLLPRLMSGEVKIGE